MYIAEIIYSQLHIKVHAVILLILEELKKIQKRCGYLKEKELVRLSEKLGIPLVEIYETGSFYSFLSTKPKGKYVIRVCNNLPCIANGSGKILE
ncbi:MAG: NAD(P)H-dependent oxidoreductase subunit E, partial [Candidatus Aenigmarchaeota archaeon]|nr:NAD(P)H-dependent oxidoreductase subunit E [Candidatus Aenigmarchaeota archaeon]